MDQTEREMNLVKGQLTVNWNVYIPDRNYELYCTEGSVQVKGGTVFFFCNALLFFTELTSHISYLVSCITSSETATVSFLIPSSL